jgi:hypothetical protein
MNISEGGMLLGPSKEFSELPGTSVMMSVPQYPSLNNYTLQKLKDFSIDLFPKKVIRAKTAVVRKSEDYKQAGFFNYAVLFEEIDKVSQKIIDNYVQTFLSNMVHLLSLIDMVNYDTQALEMVRELSVILGYPFDIKLSTLRQSVMHDYRSLQWL